MITPEKMSSKNGEVIYAYCQVCEREYRDYANKPFWSLVPVCVFCHFKGQKKGHPKNLKEKGKNEI